MNKTSTSPNTKGSAQDPEYQKIQPKQHTIATLKLFARTYHPVNESDRRIRGLEYIN